MKLVVGATSCSLFLMTQLPSQLLMDFDVVGAKFPHSDGLGNFVQLATPSALGESERYPWLVVYHFNVRKIPLVGGLRSEKEEHDRSRG